MKAAPSATRDNSLDARVGRGCRLAMIVLGSAVTLNLAALLVRACFVARAGPLAMTTGFEEFCLYNIWKAAHGFPVYEWPQRDTYLLSFYNFGFYRVYAAWTKLWHADGPQMVACVRWLSLVFTALGCGVQAHLLRRMLPHRSRRIDLALWAFSFLVWFGTSFNAWTTLSARPDVPAVALTLCGFAVALHARESGRGGQWLVASLLFFAGWSFKQSMVWTLAGTVLFSLWTRAGWGALARLVGPFSLLVVLTLVAGGEAYRYNLTEVPRIFAWLPAQSLKLLGQAVALNLFFFLCAALGWRELGASAKSLVPPRTLADPATLRWWAVACVAVPPLVMGTLQLALRGSATNNVLEGFILVTLLGTAVWLRHLEAPGDHRIVSLGMVCLALMIPLPGFQLVRAAQGATYTTVAGVSLGNLTKLTARQLAQRERFGRWLQTLPKPLWTRDAAFEMPWFATDGRYPAFVLNHQFEADARAKGVLVGDGFAEWIKRRHFACLLLSADDPLATHARAAGYVETAIPAEFDPLASEFGIDWPAPRLFTRTASAP